MATASEIVTQALKKAGVLGIGQTPSAEDANDAFLDLNDMLAQWQRKRWLVYHLVTYSFTSTFSHSYTVGPGQNFNVAVRPDKCESAYFRQLVNATPNQVDYQLKIVNAMEDYNKITLKQLTTFPEYLFYDPAWPTGLAYPWPVIQSGIYQLFLTFKEQLTAFASLAATVNLPPEYVPALKWNLAARILTSYPGLPENPKLIALAKDSLNTLRLANAQVPSMSMPAHITRRGIYNIYSDQTH
jgi:hypothetical protein